MWCNFRFQFSLALTSFSYPSPVATGKQVLFFGTTRVGLSVRKGVRPSKCSDLLEVKTKMFHSGHCVATLHFWPWKYQRSKTRKSQKKCRNRFWPYLRGSATYGPIYSKLQTPQCSNSGTDYPCCALHCSRLFVVYFIHTILSRQQRKILACVKLLPELPSTRIRNRNEYSIPNLFVNSSPSNGLRNWFLDGHVRRLRMHGRR